MPRFCHFVAFKWLLLLCSSLSIDLFECKKRALSSSLHLPSSAGGGKNIPVWDDSSLASPCHVPQDAPEKRVSYETGGGSERSWVHQNTRQEEDWARAPNVQREANRAGDPDPLSNSPAESAALEISGMGISELPGRSAQGSGDFLVTEPASKHAASTVVTWGPPSDTSAGTGPTRRRNLEEADGDVQRSEVLNTDGAVNVNDAFHGRDQENSNSVSTLVSHTNADSDDQSLVLPSAPCKLSQDASRTADSLGGCRAKRVARSRRQLQDASTTTDQGTSRNAIPVTSRMPPKLLMRRQPRPSPRKPAELVAPPTPGKIQVQSTPGHYHPPDHVDFQSASYQAAPEFHGMRHGMDDAYPYEAQGPYTVEDVDLMHDELHIPSAPPLLPPNGPPSAPFMSAQEPESPKIPFSNVQQPMRRRPTPAPMTPPPPSPPRPPWTTLLDGTQLNPASNLPSFACTAYGKHGENWKLSDDILMDWSFAGYSAGNEGLPDVPIIANVFAFGARGDGVTDDTKAFQEAIQHAQGPGAIFIPRGMYVLNSVLEVTKPGIVLRGEGQSLVTLLFNKSLTDLYGNEFTGGGPADEPFSSWKNAPGLLRFIGPDPNTGGGMHKLSSVSTFAPRHSHVLHLQDVRAIQVGQWVTLMLDPGQSGHHMNDILTMKNPNSSISLNCPMCNFSSGEGGVLRFHSQVSMVWASNSSVLLARPLPFDVILEADPKLYTFIAGNKKNGIEHLSIQMRWEPYGGHFNEVGWNGIEFSDTSNCWARNVSILNSDNAVAVYRSSFCTITDVFIGTTRPRVNTVGDCECHHGINISASQDILVTNFHLDMKCYHDLAVFNYTVGVVFETGSGPDINMDHHRFYPYATLWSNIHVGRGSRPFLSGGLSLWGPLAGAFTTFWNIRAYGNGGTLPTGPPGLDIGTHLNFINAFSETQRMYPPFPIPIIAAAFGWYREDTPAGMQLQPAALFQDMLNLRLGNQ